MIYINKITIVGLGPGEYENMSIGTLNILKNASTLVIRTQKHPLIERLKDEGISFYSCDSIYDTSDSFEEVYERISSWIIELSEGKGHLVYAVPGHPLAAEKTVQMIIKKAQGLAEVEIKSAMSFIDAIATALRIDLCTGLKVIDGLELGLQNVDTSSSNIITQVYSRFVASEIKLKLLDYYDHDQKICIIRAANVENEETILWTKLENLDKMQWIDYLTSIYIPPLEDNKKASIEELVSILERLRGDEGCSWDREQTHETLKPYLLEECYELIDAIDSEDTDLLIEELGDVLLQIALHSQIGKEDGLFDIKDVIKGLINKLIIRHPHVFGEAEASEEAIAKGFWEASKRKEKSIKSYTETLEKVPKAMPSLTRSYKVQEKAALSSFDWDDVEGAMEKVDEELLELKEVYKSTKKDKIEEEIGDLIFAIVNVSRFLKVQPELALKGTIEKFIKRFRFIEESAYKQGVSMDDMMLEQMNLLWDKAKTHNFTKNDKN